MCIKRKIDIKRNILEKNRLTQAPPQTLVNLPGNETQGGNRCGNEPRTHFPQQWPQNSDTTAKSTPAEAMSVT